MIAGGNKEIQGGICIGGVAHTGTMSVKRAAWFSGDDYVSRSFLSAPSAISFRVKVYVHSLPTNKYVAIISNSNGSTTRQEILIDTGYAGATPNIGILFSTGRYYRFTWSPSAGWHDMIAMASSTQSFFYVDGSPLSLSSTVAAGAVTTKFAVGYAVTLPTAYQTMIGTLTDLRVWDRILTVGEVANLYAGGDVATNLIAQYSGTGPTLSDWQDISGGGKDITSIVGSLDQAYIIGDRIIVNGEVKNP